FVPIYETGADTAARPPLKLDGKMTGVTQGEAWRAVAGDAAAIASIGRNGLDCPSDPLTGKKPKKSATPVHASGYVITDFGNSGACLEMAGADGPVILRTIGVQTFGLLDGMFASRTVLADFRGLPRGASAMIDLKPGVNAGTEA